MKLKVTTLLLYMFCFIHVNAQQKTDGFFNYNYYDNRNRATSYISPSVGAYQFSGAGIENMNMNAETVSISNELFVLMLMSTTYIVLRRKEAGR